MRRVELECAPERGGRLVAFMQLVPTEADQVMHLRPFGLELGGDRKGSDGLAQADGRAQAAPAICLRLGIVAAMFQCFLEPTRRLLEASQLVERVAEIE